MLRFKTSISVSRQGMLLLFEAAYEYFDPTTNQKINLCIHKYFDSPTQQKLHLCIFLLYYIVYYFFSELLIYIVNC